jgi:hypothetical protein
MKRVVAQCRAVDPHSSAGPVAMIYILVVLLMYIRVVKYWGLFSAFRRVWA